MEGWWNETPAAAAVRRWRGWTALGAVLLLLSSPAVAAAQEGGQEAGEAVVDGAAEAAAAEGAAAPAERRPGCDAPEHRQFDFWLGEWDVHRWGKVGAKEPAVNVITAVHGGCAVHEEYASPGGYGGSSLNFYDRFDGRWHQTWIDNTGQPLYLQGGLQDGRMVLADEPGGADRPRNRITWTPQEDGSVRQTWETSEDGGTTWKVIFDGHYLPRGSEAGDGGEGGGDGGG